MALEFWNCRCMSPCWLGFNVAFWRNNPMRLFFVDFYSGSPAAEIMQRTPSRNRPPPLKMSGTATIWHRRPGAERKSCPPSFHFLLSGNNAPRQKFSPPIGALTVHRTRSSADDELGSKSQICPLVSFFLRGKLQCSIPWLWIRQGGRSELRGMFPDTTFRPIDFHGATRAHRWRHVSTCHLQMSQFVSWEHSGELRT